MNIDIKNALDNLLLACRHIQSVTPDGSVEKDICRLVVGDIFHFIDEISVANANKRMDYFAKTYLDGMVCTEPVGALPVICQVDNGAHRLKTIKISTLYVSFLFTLGRHYTLSKYDKRDIDVAEFTLYIKQLNDYISDYNVAVQQKPEQVVRLRKPLQ